MHVLAFAWEALPVRRPGVHQGVFGPPDVPPVRLWAFNVGFYNLFLACGIVDGVIVWMNGQETVGRALVIYVCLFMVLAGIVLFISDRLALSGPRGKGVGGALGQGLPPLIALLAALI